MEGPWDGLPIEGTRSIVSPHQCVLSRYNCPPLDPLLFVDRKKFQIDLNRTIVFWLIHLVTLIHNSSEGKNGKN